MSKPIVKLISWSDFKGVPSELADTNDADLMNKIEDKHQDCGSNTARLVECAGRACYDSYGNGRSSESYHDHILEVGHGSVLEHVSFTFFLSNISRGLTHELVRHRAGAAISQRSTRYVDESESDYVHHPLVEKHILQNDILSDFSDQKDSVECSEVNSAIRDIEEAMSASRKAYSSVVKFLEYKLTSQGLDKLAARKQARGAARGYLGNALMTEMVWSCNLRALRNVIEQRANPAADAEIRVLANELYEVAIKICPEYLKDYEKIPCNDGIGFGLTTKHKKV